MITALYLIMAMGRPMLGTIDQIEDDIAIVEVNDADGKIETMEFSTELFPCVIKEGDWFYFEYFDDVTELRCGEPPE